MENSEKWNNRFLELAKLVSTWSKDPTTPVGAVIVRDKFILSTGYNGFPRNLSDDLDTLLNRGRKNLWTIHAEANAILTAGRHGASCEGSTIYSTLHPCSSCAAFISQSGIVKVVTFEVPEGYERWQDSFQEAEFIFQQSGIEVIKL